MLTCTDAPKTLGSLLEREARQRCLTADHVLPLTRFVREIRRDRKIDQEIPFFDPCDGGVRARVLFLGEAPGPKAVSSGFISRNNPDETAKNSFELHRDAGLPRDTVLLWNIVPWYVGNNGKIRPVSDDDLGQASAYFEPLVRLLPRLRALVLVGEKAQRAFSSSPTNLRVFKSPHPSPSNLNTRPWNRQAILESWREVASWLREQPA